MGNPSRRWYAILSLTVFGLTAVLHNWIALRRPTPSDFSKALTFAVTDSGDHGPGSLREAIYAADTANGRARIVLDVPRVTLSQPLPPIVNPAGIALEGMAKGTELDAGRIGDAALLEINSPNSVLRQIRISGAPQSAILVLSSGFHVVDASIQGSDVGVEIADAVRDVQIERTNFLNNRLGVRVGRNTSEVLLKGNLFSGQKDAGVWAVSGAVGESTSASLVVQGNTFQGNRIGAVVGDVPTTIEDNNFSSSAEASVLLFGSGAKVLGNRIGTGAGIGVFADRTQGTVIQDNEVDNNRTIGVLVRYSEGALVRKNRAFGNAYGIAFVLGEAGNPSIAVENTLLRQSVDGIILIGDSPILRRNQLISNHDAGVRVLDYVTQADERIESVPYLESNSLKANGYDSPVLGEYKAKPDPKSK